MEILEFMDKPKTKIYIDGANIFYAQKKMDWTLDWRKIKEYFLERFEIIGLNYYQGIKNNDDKIGSYLKYLDQLNINITTKPVKEIKISNDHPLNKINHYNKIYKCNFDVEITADMIFDRGNLDEYILFSGDSDFDYVVKRLRSVGKTVTVFSSKRVLSWELKLAADKFKYLENYQNIFSRDKKPL